LLLSVLDAVYGRVERLGVSPVVAGGLAVSYWGHPRSTQDIDLAVIVSDDPSFESGLRQANLLPAKGGRIIDLGFVRVSQWKFTLEGEYIDCEIDFLISNSSYHQEAIGRAKANGQKNVWQKNAAARVQKLRASVTGYHSFHIRERSRLCSFSCLKPGCD
jgi:hypothetical protein